MHENFIRSLKLGDIESTGYPFSIPAVRDIESIRFTSPVTFFVGENGTGKSTLIEAVAVAAGFNTEGGTKNYMFSSYNTVSALADTITLVRGPRREKNGFFLRAESFYTTATYAEQGTTPYGGMPAPIYFNDKRIHEQSHGEAFLSIINSFDSRPGLFIFDEPESALSPRRIIALMELMRSFIEKGSQFIIATHSPILLACPGSVIYQLSHKGLWEVAYDDVEHVKITRDFLLRPEKYLGDHSLPEDELY